MESKTNYQINDDEAVYLVSENNDEAKEYLYNKYSKLVHAEINKYKKVALMLDIDLCDLEQEGMLGFSNAINTYSSEEKSMFYSYALMCVRRKIFSYIRKNSNKKNKTIFRTLSIEKIGEEYGESFLNFLSDNSNEPLNKIITNEALAETTNFYDQLSSNEKEVIRLSLEGKSSKEIAELLGLPIKSVYNLSHRARNKLKDVYD